MKRLEENKPDFGGIQRQQPDGTTTLPAPPADELRAQGAPSASGLRAEADLGLGAGLDASMQDAAAPSDDLRLSVDLMGNRLDRTVQIFVSHAGGEREVLYNTLLAILSEMVITQLATVRCFQRTAPNDSAQQRRGAHGGAGAGPMNALEGARDDEDGINYNITLLLSPSYVHSIAALKVRPDARSAGVGASPERPD